MKPFVTSIHTFGGVKNDSVNEVSPNGRNSNQIPPWSGASGKKRKGIGRAGGKTHAHKGIQHPLIIRPPISSLSICLFASLNTFPCFVPRKHKQ